MSPATMRQKCRTIENYLVVWADANIDLNNADCQHVLTQLRGAVNQVSTCTTSTECIQLLNDNKEETTFVISSGALGQHLLPDIHPLPKLNDVSVFCSRKQFHEEWAKNWKKIKGVYTSIEPICDELQHAVKECNQDNISVSIVSVNEEDSNRKLNQLEPTFMYSQIFKEILLQMEFGDHDMKDLIKFRLEEYRGNDKEIKIINEFQHAYRPENAISWYTRECFTYKMLNGALRTLNGDIMIRMGFFLCDLHQQIEKIHKTQVDKYHGNIFQVYRGQGLTSTDFSQLEKNKNGLISFNNFLSTSTNRGISLGFAQKALKMPNMIGILFQILIDPSIQSSPFASIQEISYFKTEAEILFSMHTVFRINSIEKLDSERPLYQVDLILTSDDDKQLREPTELIREEASGFTGWTRLGKLLIKIGQFDKAEKLYNSLLEHASKDTDRAFFYHQLGRLKSEQGKYEEAAKLLEVSLAIDQTSLPEDDADMAITYGNISSVYYQQGNYSKALEFSVKDLEIKKKPLPPNHPDLAISYNTIGLVYGGMGNYTKATESYEKTLKIVEIALPPNHPNSAIAFSNIGQIYQKMGEYSKALECYEKDLEIKKKSLPADHPSFAITFANIGQVYDKKGDYLKALEFLEKALAIRQKSLPSTHPLIKVAMYNVDYRKKKL
ncbi:unnamed protein product [Rotaria socialis]|nr:unnamed protein product [Rotaria socialis]